MRAPLRVVAWMLLLLMGLTRADVAPLAEDVGSHDQPTRTAKERLGVKASDGAAGRTNAATAQARGATNDHGTRARALSSSGPSMIIRSYLVTLWALLLVSCGPTVAQSIAVFDFELIDTSLEGAIRGARPDEQERLAHLSDQLRQLLRDSGRF